MNVNEIVNDLLEVRDNLDALGQQHPVIYNDPLFYESLEKITDILEEIE